MLDWKECVQRMIDYIENHLKESLTLQGVSLHVGYSPFYCSKAFHGQVGICMKDYIRRRRMTSAALELRDTQRRILDIAIEYGYNSQEAFTRSFTDAFQVTPAAYRRLQMPLSLFVRRDINHQHIKIGVDQMIKEKFSQNIKTSIIEKPPRKMLVFHKEGATNYHELCEMEGAEEIWGLLESIKGTLGGIICAWLNEKDTTRYIWGVEMPPNYTGAVPEGFECIHAPACHYVKFCHPPYDEKMHDTVIEAVWNASELWDPKDHGWVWDDDTNPVYEDDTEREGYMVLKPIKKI